MSGRAWLTSRRVSQIARCVLHLRKMNEIEGGARDELGHRRDEEKSRQSWIFGGEGNEEEV